MKKKFRIRSRPLRRPGPKMLYIYEYMHLVAVTRFPHFPERHAEPIYAITITRALFSQPRKLAFVSRLVHIYSFSRGAATRRPLGGKVSIQKKEFVVARHRKMLLVLCVCVCVSSGCGFDGIRNACKICSWKSNPSCNI